MAMQTFGWQGIEFEHPGDWECVRFSKSRKRGECVLADPRGKRLSLCWSAVDVKSVDTKRILDEAAAQLRKSDPTGAVASRAWQAPKGEIAWSGFEWGGTDDLSVALAHFPHAGYLLQAQFTTDRRLDLAAQRKLLESIHCQRAGAPWRWRAFGCDLTLPSEYEIETCDVVPGRAALAFATQGRKQQRVRLERFAMPELQLKARNLKDWYASTLENARRILGSQETEIGPHQHPGVLLDLKPGRPKPMQLLTRVKRASRAAVWVCECEARLYKAEWEGATEGAPKLEDVVACCGGVARVEPIAPKRESRMVVSGR